MKKIVIVTGANRGLGKSIVDLVMKNEDVFVFSISRSLHPDQENLTSDKFKFIKADLREPFSTKLLEPIDEYISAEISLFYFNNAGVIEPIQSVGNHYEKEIRYSIAVNILFPVEFTNSLIKRYSRNKQTVINITSGAAGRPIANWSLYCAAKAYMLAYYKVFQVENEENDMIKVHNVDPGVMDTGMQKEIRKNDFPEKEYFNSLKNDQNLISPFEAAINVLNQINFNL